MCVVSYVPGRDSSSDHREEREPQLSAARVRAHTRKWSYDSRNLMNWDFFFFFFCLRMLRFLHLTCFKVKFGCSSASAKMERGCR